MIVFGKNVARDLLLNNNKKVEKIILQEGFSDNEILSLIENRKINVQIKQKREDLVRIVLLRIVIVDILIYRCYN